MNDLLGSEDFTSRRRSRFSRTLLDDVSFAQQAMVNVTSRTPSSSSSARTSTRPSPARPPTIRVHTRR
jgi:hypothetical protein